MKRETLQSVLPLVKKYAAGRGKGDQKFHTDNFVHGNAVAAIVGGSPLSIKHQPFLTTYCFNNLGNGLGVVGRKAVLMQLQPCPHDLNEEAYRHYIQWVLNYSPWRHIFVTKSINKALKTGVVVIDASSKKNTMMDGMIALRQAWDNYNFNPRYPQIGMWWDLIQKVNPSMAFAIVSNLLYLKDGKVAKGIIHSGHSPFARDRKSLDNFVRGDLQDDSSPFNQSVSPNAWEIWQHGNDGKLSKLVSEAVASIGKKKGKVNPFSAAVEESVFIYDQVIDCLINEIPNMEKEIGV